MTKRVALGCAILLLGSAMLSFAQRSERINSRMLISTRAGLVTRVAGNATLQPEDGRAPETVAPRLQMLDGDILRTATGSRVEVLARPDAFLRLGETTEIRALNTALTDARFQLQHGLLVIEVDREGTDLAFEVVSRHGIVTIRRAGLYWISVEPTCTRVDVLEGELRVEADGMTKGDSAARIKSGRRVELRNPPDNALTVTRLLRKPFEELDGWNFPTARHGTIVRCEGNVLTFCSILEQPCRVSTGHPVDEGSWLFVEESSYANLRINSAERLSLGPRGQLRAAKSEGNDAVFELKLGPAIVVTDDYMLKPASLLRGQGRFSMGVPSQSKQTRPLKIITPHGVFAIGRSSVIRFDVTPVATEVSVRKGRVTAQRQDDLAGQGSRIIGEGQRVRLATDASQSSQGMPFNRNAMDALDRWTLGSTGSGRIEIVEGRVLVERRAGVYLERAVGVQMGEGDRLMTAFGSRALVRLDLNTVLFVDEVSVLRMISTDRAAPRIELQRGAAVLRRASMHLMAHLPAIELATPHASARISKYGEYRLDARDAHTTIAVRSGALLFGPGNTAPAAGRTDLKEGQLATLPAEASGWPLISKSAGSEPDEFDLWVKSMQGLGRVPAGIR